MTSSLDEIYKKMAPNDNHEEDRSPEPRAPFDSARYVSPVIAHELNNILAIVQGYAERLIIKYANDTALLAQLKMMTEAARRGATIVRDATPPSPAQIDGKGPKPQPQPTIA